MTPAAKKKIFDGRYEIISIVGRGQCSVVYHARHVSAQSTEVALKVLLDPKDGSSTRENLRKEALAMVSARSKYVIRLDDFHSVGDLSYLSMEYAPECDLRKYVKKIGGKLGSIQGELFLLQSCEALSITHQAGIIHRDIKPDNLLVISDKEIRLGDFGVAVLPGEEAHLKDLEKGVGTMSYMAPEVLEGVRYDKRSDIYALGVSFYEMISGVHPFERAPLIQQIDIRKDGAFAHLSTLVKDAPKHLTNAIMQAMSFEPEKRFQTTREFIQTILVNRSPTTQSTTSPASEPPRAVVKPTPVPKAEQPKQEENRASIVERPVVQPREVSQATRPSNEEATIQADSESSAKSTEYLKVSPAPSQPEQSISPTPPARPAKQSSLVSQAIDRAEQPPFEADADEDSVTKTAMFRHDQISDQIKAKPERINKKEMRSKRENRKFEELKLPKAPRRITPLHIGLAAGILILIFGPMLSGPLQRFFSSFVSQPSTKPVEIRVSTIESPIKQYAGQALTFPLLPQGMYVGQVSNLIPGNSAPLTVISINDQLVFMLGIEGFKPVAIPLDKFKDPNYQGRSVVRLRANGVVLDFEGSLKDGKLTGEFKDFLSGDTGSWVLMPVTESAAA